jgi:hypothetical protein
MRLIDADALFKVVNEFDGDVMIKGFIKLLITNAPTVEREIPLTYSKYKTVMHCLNKISEFCPDDENVNQLDESPENMIRLSFAEIGDTARSAIVAILATEPVVQREGWVSVPIEPNAHCFEKLIKEQLKDGNYSGQYVGDIHSLRRLCEAYCKEAMISAAPKE